MKSNQILTFDFLNKCMKFYYKSIPLYNGIDWYSDKLDDIEMLITPTAINFGNDYFDCFLSTNTCIRITTSNDYNYNDYNYYIDLCNNQIFKRDYTFFHEVQYDIDGDYIKNLGKLTDEEVFFIELKYGNILTL